LEPKKSICAIGEASDVAIEAGFSQGVGEKGAPGIARVKLFASVFLALLAALNARTQGVIWSTDKWAEHSETPGASWPIAFDYVSDIFEPPPRQNPATRIFFMTLTTNVSHCGAIFFAAARKRCHPNQAKPM
jgi:hypothetical protein